MAPLYQMIVPILAAISYLSNSQTILNSTYTKNTRLTISNSPYQVVTDVVIESDVIFEVENGVEIIFMDEQERTIQIKGHLIVGCNDIDTSLHTNRGLADSTTFTYIHSNGRPTTRRGRFTYSHRGAYNIGHDATVQFCNVKFSGLFQGIEALFNDRFEEHISFDNCEFTNIQSVSYLIQSSSNVTFTDSYFHGVNNIAFGHAIYENCKFESFNYFDRKWGPTMYDSEVDCSGVTNWACIESTYVNLYGVNIFERNIIKNAPVAIWINADDAIFRYNKIINSSVGLALSFGEDIIVQYNNFIDNDINVRGSYDDSYLLPYNYWGIDAMNETKIASKIIDICDGYYESLITWWPFYIEPVNFDDLENLPQEYTISEFVCRQNNPFSDVTGSSPTLPALYISDATLTVDESPYYVIYDVRIRNNVTLYVENGVEIIFMGGFTILLEGQFSDINIGCNDIDTVSNTQRGLADDTIFTYIHSYDTDQRMGRMVLAGIFNPIFKICNAKIESLYQPLHFEEPGNAFVDNCEFNNNYQAIAYDSISDWTASQYIERVTQEVYDSIFRGNYISVSGHPFVDNIEVFNIETDGYVGDFYYATITGSTFNCGGADRSICLSLKGDNNTLSHNVIRNSPGDAIYVESFLNTITYNVIRGNQIGVKIDRDYQLLDLHYNDFIENAINVQAFGWDYSHECSLNYYGTDNETEIAKSINDICNGFSSSVVIWWPYFSESVSDSSSLPDPVEVEDLQCPASGDDMAWTVLPYVFPEDTILTVRDSPYYVTNNVFIQEGITLSIENGVEIIFTGDYYIGIRGVVDCGCSDIRKQPNDPKHRGLYLPNYVHIYSEEFNQEGYGFRLEDKGQGYFCHTLFESLQYGIYDNSVSADAILSVENCEFKENDHGMYGQTQSSKEVKDSIFESNKYAIRYFDYASIDNCLFTLNKWGSISYCKDANISNSDVDGRHQSYYDCIYIWYYSSSYFINNTVSNCDTGYRPLFYLRDDSTSSVQVMYNDFTNNVYAFEPHIDSWTVGDAVVSYNNFMNNTYAVYINMDSDFSMPYNYFGQDNVFNPQIISDVIRDDCDIPDQDPYDDGAAIFWPWLLSPVTSINDLPESYTIDAVRCPPIPSPTSSPSTAPTISIEPCDCNSIELLRIYTLRTDTICYKYETHFCNNDVRRFTMSVNEQSCGLSDISALIRNIRPNDLIWSINNDGNIQIEDLMDGETFTLCLDSTKVLGTNPSGVIQYRIGNKWIGCRQIANVLPDYCGLS